MGTGIRSTLRFVQKENVRLRAENEQLRTQVDSLCGVLDALRQLQDVAANITIRTDVLELLNQILKSALASIGATDGSLLLVDERTNELVFVVVHGAIADTLVGFRIAPGVGIAGWVAQNQEPVIVPNAHLDPRFSEKVDQTFHFHTNSLMCVPIVYAGETLGVIQALNKVGTDFNDADLAILNVVGQLAAAAMNKADTILPEPRD